MGQTTDDLTRFTDVVQILREHGVQGLTYRMGFNPVPEV